jgi:hypothetical protein
MTEREFQSDLAARGIWRVAPGLWCDASVPDLIAVAPERDNAADVHAALAKAEQLPPRDRKEDWR